MSAALAQELLASGQIDRAQDLLPLLARDDGDGRSRGEASYLMAAAAVMSHKADEAIAYAKDAIAALPRDARCQFALGRAYKLAGRIGDALAAYRRAVALDPTHAEAHVSLGIALKHGGKLREAIGHYEHALSLKPDLAAAHANLAYARAALVEAEAEAGADEAVPDALVDSAARAAELDAGNATLHFNLGLLLRRSSRRPDAMHAFNRALGIAPDHLGYCLHLGQELAALGAPPMAIQLYRRWLEINPPQPVVMRHLADLLGRAGEVGAALELAEKSFAMEADPRVYLQLCGINQQCRRLDRALVYGLRAIEESGRMWQMYSIPVMVANYRHEDPEVIARMHADFGRALAASLTSGRVRRSPRALAAGERLRIGYVSGDFSNHSVAFFIAPLLERHDRSRFETWCYYNRAASDDVTAQLRGWSDHWVDCEPLSDEGLARRIEADGIHILIDLSAHTSGGRVRLFGLAPAPLQIGYLGYPTASGVQTIERRITDAAIDPGDMPATGSEAPLVLGRSMFCYRPPPDAPAIAPEPPQHRNDHVTFGSFNNHAKISDACLALWARILVALPGSKLLLKSASVSDPLCRAELFDFMAGHGIDADRLDLRARIAGRNAHLELYNEVDVALDPFPYNGATTTCEALWMGVPVVSLRGRTHSSRMGASILSAVGKTEWVLGGEMAYLERALTLASDARALADWRRSAREVLCASELCDEAGFVREVERALHSAWAEGMND